MKRLITLCSITLALSAFAGVTARYTFDDAGNGGLNLLKASVGEDAIVRGGKPAADVSGIGELYATNGQGRVDGKGAVAVPKGQFLAIPHGLTKSTGQKWFLRLKVFMPKEEIHTIISFSQNNQGDGYLFQRSTQSLGGSVGWGTYVYVTGTPMIGNWKTILLNCDGSGTDLYVNDVKVARTIEGAAFSGLSNLTGIDYLYISGDNSGEDNLMFIDEIVVGSGSYYDQLVTVPNAGSAVYNGQYHESALTNTTDYTVTSSVGGTEYGFYPVTAALTDPSTKTWEDGTTADKTLWFAIRDALTPEVKEHLSFNDDGNGGLNLLKATVGEDAWVMGGNRATNVVGIGSIVAVNGQGHTDGKGAVAIPAGEFIALPHGFERSFGPRWRLDMMCCVPDDGKTYHSYFTIITNNSSDAALFNHSGTQLGCGSYWPSYKGGLTTREVWHTVSVMSDGMEVSLWVNGAWVMNALPGKLNDFTAIGYLGICADNNGEDNTMFVDDVKTYVQKPVVVVAIPPDAGSAVATGETFEAPIVNTCQYAVRGARPSASAVGAYPVTLGLLDPEHMVWSDGTSDDKTVMFTIAAAANSWTEEPKVGALSWTAGTASPAYTRGVSAYGTVSVYLDGLPLEGDLPTEEGTYELAFVVPATAERAGLRKSFVLSVLPAGEAPVVVPQAEAYAANGLFMHLDGLENAGMGRHDGNTATWTDVTGNGYDWNVDSTNAEWHDDGLYFKGTGMVAVPVTKTTADFNNRVNTVEFIWSNAAKTHGIIFGPGFSGSSYLYTDTDGSVGFFSTSGAASSIGVPAQLDFPVAYSVDYVRAENAVKPTGVNSVTTNGVMVAETINMNNYWNGGLTSYPLMGNLAPGYTQRRAKGTLKALRIYNRSLTESERTLNSALDFLRYGTGFLPETIGLDGYLVNGDPKQLLVRVKVTSAGGALSVNGSEPMHDGTYWMPIGSVVMISGKFKSVKPDRIGAYIREGLPSGAVVSEDGRKVTFMANAPAAVRIGHPDVHEGFFLSIR